MNFPGVFAVIAVLLGVAGYGNGAEFEEKCPVKLGVQCFVNPCDKNQCGSGKICCSNYTSACSFDCYDCPRSSQPICIRNPCEGNPCGPGQSCCPDSCKPCQHRCFS